jgi:integrase
MGWTETRKDSNGELRYIAKYRDVRCRKQSAGTFATEREANRAWLTAEMKIAEGRIGDPRRGRQTFRRYVQEEWLPNHVMEPSTRESYTYQIGKHIMPWFGRMKMVEILPCHVREWVTGLRQQRVGPKTIQNLRNILSAIFTTALNDQVTFLHRCKGVKTPTVPVRPPVIIGPEQFDRIYGALPDDATRLLVETAIETGLRWGELTELRVYDIDLATRLLTVSRAVVQLDPKFHPESERFLVKPYPRDKEYRRFRLSAQICAKIAAHVDAERLSAGDLIFRLQPEAQPRPLFRVVPSADGAYGLTEPNAAGRRYRHGTLSGYSAGKCRCQRCKDSYAIYRAGRRATGRDHPRSPRPIDTDGHIPRDWFRIAIWKPALQAAGLGFHVPVKNLRHAHASWLLAGGADLQVVKERLGHAKISTTEKYLRTLPGIDETALDALAKIRNRTPARPA